MTSLGLPQEEQDVEENVNSLEKAIGLIEDQLSTLFEVPAEQIQSKLAQFEQAKLSIVTVYAINTLFYSMFLVYFLIQFSSNFFTVYLKTQGLNPNQHPVKKELVCMLFFFASY
jgi:exosome complex protein LRP1